MMYTTREKLSAIKLIVSCEMSCRDAAKAIGLPPGVIYYFIYEDLKIIDRALYRKVRRQLIKNAKRWKGEQAYALRPLD